MKTLFAVIVLCAALVLPAQAAEPSTSPSTTPVATQPASGTRYSNRALTIKFTNIAPKYVDLLNFSNMRASELAPQVLELSSDYMQEWLSLNWDMPQSDREVVSYDLKFSADLKQLNGRPATKEFMDQLIASIEEYVKHDFEQQRAEKILPVKLAKEDASNRVDMLSAKVADLRAFARKTSGRVDVSAKSIAEALTRLEDENQKLELDVLAKTARREALERQIAEQSALIEKKIASDPIAVELEKVVKAREEAVEIMRKQQDAALVSPKEVSDAVATMAEARAKLLQRKRDAAAEAGGETLELFNRELLTLSVDLREMTAKRDFIKTQLPGLQQAMDQIGELDRASEELARARKELTQNENELRRFDRQFIKPPQIVVYESMDRDKRPEQKKAEPAAP